MGRISSKEEASAPGTPSGGYVTLYFLASGSGVPVTKDDAGAVRTVIVADSNGDVTIAGDLLLSGGSQNYLFSDRSTSFTLQSQTAATSFEFGLYAKDGDGTDSIVLAIYGVGTPADVTNLERILIRYQNTAEFSLTTNAGGSGTVRPLRLETGANTNQIYLATDGTVGLGTAAPGSKLEINLATEDLEIVDAGSAAATEQDWIEVQVGGATGYIRVFAAK